MQKTIYLFLVSVLLCSNSAFAQIHALTFVANSGQIKLASINPVTGTVTEVAPGSTVASSFQAPNACMNPYTNMYYFIADAAAVNSYSIKGVNLNTGLLVSSVLISFQDTNVNFINQITFNCKDSMIYCLSGKTTESGKYRLSRVNPGSGSVTTFTNALTQSITAPNACIDPVNGTFFYVNSGGNSTDSLVGVNITNGAISSKKKLIYPSSSPSYVNQLTYNCKDSSIYCFSALAVQNSTICLAKLKPSNGVVSPVSSSLATRFSAPNACIDPLVNRFYYISGNGDSIVSVNISNGSIAASHLLAFSNASLNFVNQIKSKNACACVAAPVTTALRQETIKQEVYIYPNPLTDNSVYIENKTFEKITSVNLMDLNGNALGTLAASGGNKYTIKNETPPGIYILEIVLDTKTVIHKKITKRD